ncbi:S8/S53 family peptidase [Sorangium cellulosum]|uniref:S8/S53 family peptidase n=1 Tax=Sorangium cellulosum TaxID=56 RepID=UPI000AB4A2DF|nr:S8/S53 family peptidase [Sorangium cellulosum]
MSRGRSAATRRGGGPPAAGAAARGEAAPPEGGAATPGGAGSPEGGAAAPGGEGLPEEGPTRPERSRSSAPPPASAASRRERPPRPPWEFGYAPVPTAACDDDGGPLDVVVAARGAVAPDAVAAALSARWSGVEVERIVERAPIFWLRVRSPDRGRRAEVAAALAAAGLPVRYVASARRTSAAVAPRFDAAPADAARPDEGWAPRGASDEDEPVTPGRWFLRAEEGGIAVDRRRCGTGAGMRLGVIDDDAQAVDELGIDREVLVLVEQPPRSQAHGALMVAWAVGLRRPGGFRGVAPDASPRLYLIPKPGACVLALPVAIVRAVSDGADVVVCAAYIEGSTTPMLDDALEFAARLGRRGRGCPVVFPTGREASSPPDSLHASFSLGFGEPASDPRVFCVGPGARGEGWFLWRDRRRRSRPFANRGPAVRWLAPGDDLTCPLPPASGVGPATERLCHAESSGASALAAGALLLVLAQNPALRVPELDDIVRRTLDPVPPEAPASAEPAADRWDLLPEARDRDGHNAKHGYGRMDAGRACLAAGDPIALALVLLGEDDAARAWHDARAARPLARGLYSRRLARWAVRALLADPGLCHGLCALARHARLTAGDPRRQRAHGVGVVLRHLSVLVRGLAVSRPAPARSPGVREELATLLDGLERSATDPDAVEAVEAGFGELAAAVFVGAAERAAPESAARARSTAPPVE